MTVFPDVHEGLSIVVKFSMSSHLSNAANAALGGEQRGVQNKDRQAYQLLNLTESESDQDHLPDLNLIAPAPINNGAAHRIKKKIRLKR